MAGNVMGAHRMASTSMWTLNKVASAMSALTMAGNAVAGNVMEVRAMLYGH